MPCRGGHWALLWTSQKLPRWHPRENPPHLTMGGWEDRVTKGHPSWRFGEELITWIHMEPSQYGTWFNHSKPVSLCLQFIWEFEFDRWQCTNWHGACSTLIDRHLSSTNWCYNMLYNAVHKCIFIWEADKIAYYSLWKWPKCVVPYRLWRFVFPCCVKIGYR